MQKGKLIAAEEMNKGGIDKDVFMDFFKASGGIVVTLLMSLIFLLSVMSQASASIFLSFWLEQGSGVSAGIRLLSQAREISSLSGMGILLFFLRHGNSLLLSQAWEFSSSFSGMEILFFFLRRGNCLLLSQAWEFSSFSSIGILLFFLRHRNSPLLSQA